jgi:hypothetical protein
MRASIAAAVFILQRLSLRGGKTPPKKVECLLRLPIIFGKEKSPMQKRWEGVHPPPPTHNFVCSLLSSPPKQGRCRRPCGKPSFDRDAQLVGNGAHLVMVTAVDRRRLPRKSTHSAPSKGLSGSLENDHPPSPPPSFSLERHALVDPWMLPFDFLSWLLKPQVEGSWGCCYPIPLVW